MGASWVRKNILEQNPDADFSVHVVWVTNLGATRADVDTDLFGDDRVTSYWDPQGLVGEVVTGDSNAWDFYALYDAEVEWGGDPVGTGVPVIAEADKLKSELASLS